MSFPDYRRIIHVDMDAFFAAVEQRDNRDLQGKPVAIGSDSNRGVVSTASYEARRYGVKSAMSSVVARKKCPHLIFVKPRFEVYSRVSGQLMDIFYEYTDLVEPLSIDEAYLDVTVNKINCASASIIAKEIKTKIESRLNLTASAGVSYNKFLAKIASEMNKPNGLTVITPDMAVKVIENLPIEKFFGVGPVTARKLNSFGIKSGKELRKTKMEDLVRLVGKQGLFFHQIASGVDNREVEPVKERKSLGVEYTFDQDLLGIESCQEKIPKLTEELMQRSNKSAFYGKTLILKVKFNDFSNHTKSKTLLQDYRTLEETLFHAKALLDSFREDIKPVRLLGLSFSNSKTSRYCDTWQMTIPFED